jgi:hypothetical protein
MSHSKVRENVYFLSLSTTPEATDRVSSNDRRHGVLSGFHHQIKVICLIYSSRRANNNTRAIPVMKDVI